MSPRLMKVDESLMCSAMEITVWLKSLWTDTVALTGEGEANNLNDIRRLNKWNCNAIQQSVQFLSVHELRSAITLKKKKNENHSAVHIFQGKKKRSCPHKMRSSNLQLSISRVQFCSSSGYLLRSIMQAAVVVILNQNQNHKTGAR